MSTLVTRAGKGSPLTHNEVDANFTNLNTDKIQSGNTVAALTITALTTPSVQASGSGGLALKNSAGTTQVSMGAGGGDNVTVSAPIAITPANGLVNIAPTGTGSLTINPATAGTINNMSIGATTASTGAFSTLSATGVTTVQAGTVSLPAITTTGDTNTGIFFPAADTIAFAEGGTESMRIDSSGNVGIGITAPAAKIDVYREARVSFADSNQYRMRLTNTDGNGRILVDGDASALIFGTSAAGTNATATERMRIDSSGNLLVGRTSTGNTVYGTSINSTGQLFLVVKTGNNQGIFLNRQDDTGNAITFRQANADVGSISVTGSTTSYNITSDYRLKENVVPMTNALATVSALKPVTYKWKLTGENGQGFIAHELQAIVPDCVVGEKDAMRTEQYEISPTIPAEVDEDGKVIKEAVEAVMGEREVPVYQGIDTSFLVATLTAAIQELNAKVDAQAAQITVLTTRLTALETA